MLDIFEIITEFLQNHLPIFILGGGVLMLVVHLFAIEKYHRKEENDKAVVKRDILGSPIHMVFTVGDSLIFVSIFNYFKDLPKDQYLYVFSLGIFVIIIGIIFYRLLQVWFEKHPVERKRTF